MNNRNTGGSRNHAPCRINIIIQFVVRLARLLAHLRDVAPTWNSNDSQGSNYAYTLPAIEEPDRAIQQLTNLARGHALTQGRNYITQDDIPLIIEVVLSTASKERVIISDLLLAHDGKLTASEISTSLNMSHPTARKTMLELWVRLVDKDNPEDNSSAQQISLRPEFEWFLTEEFRTLRYGDGKDNHVVSPKSNSEQKEKCPLSSENFIITDNPSLLPDKEAAFRKIFSELEEEQKKLSNCMEVDKTTVSGWELKQRLVSSGKFYTSDAQMMIEEMVNKGELKMVTYDTYVRGSTKREDDSAERKMPP